MSINIESTEKEVTPNITFFGFSFKAVLKKLFLF